MVPQQQFLCHSIRRPVSKPWTVSRNVKHQSKALIRSGGNILSPLTSFPAVGIAAEYLDSRRNFRKFAIPERSLAFAKGQIIELEGIGQDLAFSQASHLGPAVCSRLIATAEFSDSYGLPGLTGSCPYQPPVISGAGGGLSGAVGR
jgi:hypothetical protein